MCFFCDLPYSICDKTGCCNLCCNECGFILGTQEDYDKIIDDYSNYFREIVRLPKTKGLFVMCVKVKKNMPNKKLIDDIYLGHVCNTKKTYDDVFCKTCI